MNLPMYLVAQNVYGPHLITPLYTLGSTINWPKSILTLSTEKLAKASAVQLSSIGIWTVWLEYRTSNTTLLASKITENQTFYSRFPMVYENSTGIWTATVFHKKLKNNFCYSFSTWTINNCLFNDTNQKHLDLEKRVSHFSDVVLLFGHTIYKFISPS